MKTILYVAIGGSVGAVLRYLISGWVYQWLGRGFPWGTLVVNVVGSFLMGFLFFLFTQRVMITLDLRIAILVGGLGSLTTFSTFSMETLNLIEGGANPIAFANIVFSVVLTVFAVWLGMWMARMV
ncbi:MAG: fluoride efflux transporter CrcB [Magnetococcales bacterium]|nr:fluoride efflux transporter CrcB [Magnetococcales bacterium]